MLLLEPARRRRAVRSKVALALAGGGPLGAFYELGALHQMGVPGSRDIDKLSARVNTLNASIEKLARQRATSRSGNGRRAAATPPPAAH